MGRSRKAKQRKRKWECNGRKRRNRRVFLKGWRGRERGCQEVHKDKDEQKTVDGGKADMKE